MTYKENGRIYPRSCQASAVREALLKELPENAVISDYTVSSIKKDGKNGYLIDGKHFDCIVFACGGISAKAHGSDGSAYKFIKELSHTFTELKPALTALTCTDKELKDTKGTRIYGTVTLKINGKIVQKNSGEIQFTEKAISGIPVFDLSYLFDEKSKNELVIDTCDNLTKDEILSFLIKQSKRSITAEDVLAGIIPRKLGYVIINRLKIKQNTYLKNLSEENLKDICKLLKNLKFSVSGTRSFDDSQVTCGGVNPKEINPESLMSNINKGMFFCGEILPVNGDCGGYNLHFAFTTGRIAAKSVFDYLKEMKNDKT